MTWNDDARHIMQERFGHDCLIALATVMDGVPHVRQVNALYIDGAFYVITHGLSSKMRQIAQNPAVAIAGDWFTAHGMGLNLGFWGKPENAPIAQQLMDAFTAWIHNGHTDLTDENTCILQLRLTDAVLMANGIRYETKGAAI